MFDFFCVGIMKHMGRYFVEYFILVAINIVQCNYYISLLLYKWFYNTFI